VSAAIAQRQESFFATKHQQRVMIFIMLLIQNYSHVACQMHAACRRMPQDCLVLQQCLALGFVSALSTMLFSMITDTVVVHERCACAFLDDTSYQRINVLICLNLF